MKTTDSKDLVKVNPTLPIMQEYFGNSMNLARIKLMAYIAPRTLCSADCKPSQTGFGNAYVGWAWFQSVLHSVIHRQLCLGPWPSNKDDLLIASC